MELKIRNFKGDKIETREKKTGKLQYRYINPNITTTVMEYAGDNKLSRDDKLFTIGVKAVQYGFRVIKAHLGLRKHRNTQF